MSDLKEQILSVFEKAAEGTKRFGTGEAFLLWMGAKYEAEDIIGDGNSRQLTEEILVGIKPMDVDRAIRRILAHCDVMVLVDGSHVDDNFGEVVPNEAILNRIGSYIDMYRPYLEL